MATSEKFVLDDILEDLNDEQNRKLAEFWARLDILSNGQLPDFSPETFNKLGNETIKAEGVEGGEITVDMSVMQKKPAQKSLAGLTPAQLLEALRRNVKHEDPDTLLVRFLRARSWKPDDALIMLLKSLAWRIENKIEDDILARDPGYWIETAKNGTGLEQQISKDIIHLGSTGESYVYGADKKGRVLQWITVKLHNPKGQTREGFEKATILDNESTRMLLRSPHTTISVVFNLTGFGMANMDMTALKVMASGLQDNYPESLGCVYVYNAPWIINGIWSMIKAWLDPVVAAKVQFLSNIKQLSEFIDIDTIPKHMGGKNDFTFSFKEAPAPQPVSSEDTAKKAELLVERNKLLDEYIALTKVWAGNTINRAATTDAENDARHAVVTKLTDNYWKLDPLVRGKTQIDNIGMLLPGGKVNLTP